MAQALNDELPHKFDPIMDEAIIKSGNEIGNPLNEETLKRFLTSYHFDRRNKKTTDEVKKLNPGADETYVFNVFNQLFELREAVDSEKKIEGHQNDILQARIDQLRKDLERIVSRGKIPLFDKNAPAYKMNKAVSDAIQTTGTEGPLDAFQLETLIRGITKPFILVQRIVSLENEGEARTETRYFMQVVLVAQFPTQQEAPMSVDSPQGLTRVEAVVDQLKQLRSHIITNRKNDKHDYDFIYERLEKAIKGLGTENKFVR